MRPWPFLLLLAGIAMLLALPGALADEGPGAQVGLAGNYDTSGYAQSVAVSGGYAYVADWEDGLVVVDVSEPANPARAGGYDTSGSARGVAVAGDYAYVADGNSGLVVLGPDSDGDGVFDVDDLFPSDHSEWADADSDGMGDNGDAFPSDPAASVDSDGDGFPDEWNAGKSQVDSTTGLYLDPFPSDPDEWTDTDADGVGDNGDAFPSDPEEWADTDGDGVGDYGDAFPETSWLNAWWQVLLPSVIIASGAAANYGYSQYTLARRVSGKVDELKAKIAEFKEKGINTDELERVLAESEAEMGAVSEE